MALLPKKANTEGNNEKAGDRSPFPNGKYPFTIVKSEIRQTKAKTGHYLMLQCKCFEGPAVGKVHFINLNIDNPNPIAVEIADKELNSLCEAMGLVGVEDSSEMHELPFILDLVEDNSNSDYPGNKILAFLPYGGAGAPATTTTTATAPAWANLPAAAAANDPTPPTPPTTEQPANVPNGAGTQGAVPQEAEPAPAKKLPWEK